MAEHAHRAVAMNVVVAQRDAGDRVVVGIVRIDADAEAGDLGVFDRHVAHGLDEPEAPFGGAHAVELEVADHVAAVIAGVAPTTTEVEHVVRSDAHQRRSTRAVGVEGQRGSCRGVGVLQHHGEIRPGPAAVEQKAGTGRQRVDVHARQVLLRSSLGAGVAVAARDAACGSAGLAVGEIVGRRCARGRGRGRSGARGRCRTRGGCRAWCRRRSRSRARRRGWTRRRRRCWAGSRRRGWRRRRRRRHRGNRGPTRLVDITTGTTASQRGQSSNREPERGRLERRFACSHILCFSQPSRCRTTLQIACRRFQPRILTSLVMTLREVASPRLMG